MAGKEATGFFRPNVVRQVRDGGREANGGEKGLPFVPERARAGVDQEMELLRIWNRKSMIN